MYDALAEIKTGQHFEKMDNKLVKACEVPYVKYNEITPAMNVHMPKILFKIQRKKH